MARLDGSKWAAAVLSVAAMCALLPSVAVARQGPGPPGGQDDEMREDLQETIEIYMIAKMKRVLALSDAQERKVIPVIEQLGAARREMNKKRRLAMMQIHLLLEDDSTPDARLAELLEAVDATDRAFRQEELRSREEIRSSLTPRQQARLLVFQEQFRRELRQRLQRMEEGDGPAGRPRREGALRLPPPGPPPPRR